MFSIIHTRRLATSTPRNATEGLPIFPPGTTRDDPAFPRRIGGGGPGQESPRNPLVDVAIPLAEWRFHANIVASLYNGSFFGFTMEYDVSGAVQNDGTGYLGIFNDRIEGGMAFGASYDVSGTIRLDEADRQFVVTNLGNPWVRTWREVANESFGFNIDLIRIMILAISVFTGTGPVLRQLNGFQVQGSLGGVWGFYDEIRDQFGTTNRAILRPRFNFSVNFLEFVPEAAKVVRALRIVGVNLFQGIILNFTFPILFRVARVATESGDYQVPGAVPGRSNLLQLQGGPVTNLPPTVSDLTVVLSHTVNFEFTIDMNTTITFLGVFGVDESVQIATLGQQNGISEIRPGGPFFTALRDSGPMASTMEIPEVEWG